MKQSLVCIPRIAKNISYILVPILIALLLASVVSIIVIESEDVLINSNNNYYDTEKFVNKYLGSTYNVSNFVFYDYFSGGYTDKAKADINGKAGNIYYNQYLQGNFKYLIVNNKTRIATTNITLTTKTDTIEEIIENLKSDEVYWNYKNGKVQTNIDSLKLENIKYNSFTSSIADEDIDIYTILVDNLPYKDSYFMEKICYNFLIKLHNSLLIIMPIAVTLLAMCIILIIKGIGKSKKTNDIYLTWFDKLKLGIALIIGISIFIIGFGVAIISYRISFFTISLMGILVGLITMYLSFILLFETIVKRIKSHTLVKSTIIYAIGKGTKSIIDHRNMTTKLIIYYGTFCILGFFFTARIAQAKSKNVFIYLMLLLLLGFLSLWYLFCRLREFEKIRTAIKSIYEGNTNIVLNPEEQKGVLKELSIYIQDIAGGLSNAVNESLKSERLKTELITNVSHDIKTPLTSIINYVDLLKKEEMPNEKCREYLTILDNKSQRLKKLTEDLVEASKASSGSIKLQIEKIDVVELVKQVSGEFEDRFKKRGLEEIRTLPEEPIFINADSRYIYRVLENIYSNAAKYALENTRIYLDVVAQKKSVVIQMKNISQEKLNISADELMQRFVRGEASRNTEGSGLGLSIASSLTELQGGKFHIYLDGDLFKITLGFERI